MLSSGLKLSVFLIAAHFVYNSHQQCLGISKIKTSDYSFALAGIKDVSNPTGPQEACYVGCGAQIVTQSSNKGDMARLTLMDSAVSALTSTGFLQSGQSYFLNHLGMEEAEGGNGIGCIQVLGGNKVAHYPRSHQVCSSAKVAICGFWGQQSIPPQSASNAISSSKPSPTTTSTLATPTTTGAIRPTSPTTLPTTTATTPITTVAAVAPETSRLPPSGNQSVSNVLHQFSADGRNYHVVSMNGMSLVQASQSCQNAKTNIGGVTSVGFQAVAQNLQSVVGTTGNKLVIRSWNGDNYSLQGNNCLILQVNNGIYPGSCTEAKAVLCQS